LNSDGSDRSDKSDKSDLSNAFPASAVIKYQMSNIKCQIIACFSKNRVIGKGGKMPWYFPEDLRRFKKITMGHTLIMGRKTFESIEKPLEGRKIIILSRDDKFNSPVCDVVESFEKAIELANKTDDKPIVCGGSEVYKAALPFVRKMYLTEIQREIPGDTFFPDFEELEWRETERQEKGELVFRVLEKV